MYKFKRQVFDRDLCPLSAPLIGSFVIKGRQPTHSPVKNDSSSEC